LDESGCSFAGQRARNNLQLAKLIVAGASELVDVQGGMSASMAATHIDV